MNRQSYSLYCLSHTLMDLSDVKMFTYMFVQQTLRAQSCKCVMLFDNINRPSYLQLSIQPYATICYEVFVFMGDGEEIFPLVSRLCYEKRL